MSLQTLPGGSLRIGPNDLSDWITGNLTTVLSTANYAFVAIGRVRTKGGGSHTIDTTGSSAIGWLSGTGTVFSNAGTSVSVGLAAVDTGNGPPGRAVNVSNVITFDVKAVLAGGGGGIAASTWLNTVPTTGSKTIADGDLVAFCVQMTAKAGSDSVWVDSMTSLQSWHQPVLSWYSGAWGLKSFGAPNVIITFSDGTVGWIEGCDVFSVIGGRTWSSASTPKEYGQLYQFPFPVRIIGAYGVYRPLADVDIVLYSDPLGTPTAQGTATIDANTVANTNHGAFRETFPSPYDLPADTPIGVVFKPGASSVSVIFKTLNNSAHRVADPWGTTGYGISRSSGAFSNDNSSLNHYPIGLLVTAADGGGGAVGGFLAAQPIVVARGTPF